MEEKKMLEFKFENGKVLLTVDPNKDGQPVFKAEIDAAEVPDEILSAIKKK
jgi:hypothetical protein